ncbi:MAG TPA: helix-hairpin-helix domain-containing protein [Planctomycetaceae bacterium]|nr:helix-hairpin-helix domain-containing protein [Planctomycetaceae bacterium]
MSPAVVKINTLVASTLRQLAGALALERASEFKVKAYRRAAHTIDHLDRDMTGGRRGSALAELQCAHHR